MNTWIYALLLAGSIAIPLARSFEYRINFRGKWPAVFTGIFVMMLVFIPWDVWFTARNIWHFNPDFVGGVYLLGLPVEEWLFFIVIPYAVMFIYEVLKYFFPKVYFPQTAKYITLLLIALMVVIAIINTDKLYTFVVTALTAFLLILQLALKNHNTWLSKFYFSYLVSLLPFLIVNGVLTALPVVIYNDAENLAFRLTTVPVEDFAYLMSMMLIVTMVHEYILLRRNTG